MAIYYYYKLKKKINYEKYYINYMEGICIDISQLIHYFLCIKKPNDDKDFIIPKKEKKSLIDDYCIIEEYMYNNDAKKKKND